MLCGSESKLKIISSLWFCESHYNITLKCLKELTHDSENWKIKRIIYSAVLVGTVFKESEQLIGSNPS